MKGDALAQGLPFHSLIRLVPTMEPLHTLATVWNTLLMTNILSLRPQPECPLCREAFHNHLFPQHLPPKIILSYPVLSPHSILPFAMLRVFDFLFICLAPSLGLSDSQGQERNCFIQQSILSTLAQPGT